MAFVLFLTLAASAPASSFWSRCAKYLVADDPHQFEQCTRDWLSREVERLEIKRRWGTLSPSDASILSIMRAEIKRREIMDTLLYNGNHKP